MLVWSRPTLRVGIAALSCLVLHGCREAESPDAGLAEPDAEFEILAACSPSDQNGPADITILFDDEGKCLRQSDPNDEESCVAPIEVEVEKNQKLIFKSENSGRFNIIDTPRQSRPSRLRTCVKLQVSAAAAYGNYKYMVVGEDRDCPGGYQYNTCDPRIKVDPK